MKDIEFYKKRIIFYKDKIKIGLLARPRNTEIKDKNNIYFLTNKKKFKILIIYFLIQKSMFNHYLIKIILIIAITKMNYHYNL